MKVALDSVYQWCFKTYKEAKEPEQSLLRVCGFPVLFVCFTFPLRYYY